MMMKKLMRWCFALELAAREWWWWKSWWDDVLHWYWRPGRGLHLGRLGCTLLPTGAELHCDAHSSHSTTICTLAISCTSSYMLHCDALFITTCTSSYKLHCDEHFPLGVELHCIAHTTTSCTSPNSFLQAALQYTLSFHLQLDAQFATSCTPFFTICPAVHNILQVALRRTSSQKLHCTILGCSFGILGFDT